MQKELAYTVIVLVQSQDYEKTFTVRAPTAGLAKTRAIKLATDGDLRLSGELVEYIVKN